MIDRGTVRETYGAALRLGEITPEPDDLVVEVDPEPSVEGEGTGEGPPTSADRELATALAPPAQLRFDLDRALDRRPSEDEAWDAVRYEPRYRAFLESDAGARDALARLRRHLAARGTVWFVCPANTPEQRRHRTVLVDVLGEDVRADGG
jgi:hypothetical protein